ncbi:MAG: phosphoserine phosphatase SerB [Actinomycetota bacterium]|nr:phosphoserine phosphatase SerB [Actinomycetota bacterium]
MTGANLATMVVTLSGQDRPGVTRDLFSTCSRFHVVVRDIDQIVMKDRLILACSVEGTHDDIENLKPAISTLAGRLDMDVVIDVRQRAAADEPLDSSGGFRITMMASELDPQAVADIASHIASGGGNIDRIRPIAHYPVTAIGFEGSGVDPDELRRPLATVSAERGVDIAVQETGLDSRGQYLVVMDVDSTVIQDEVIDLLAAEAGQQTAVAAVTERAMAGEIDFSESLHQRVALLAGLPDSALAVVRDRIQLTPGARTLCRTLNRLGYRIALVSGGFTQVVAPIAQQLGVAELRANTLEIENGQLTGRVVGEIVDRPGKRKALEDLAVRFGIPRRRTIAIGDGANDIDMLEAAGLGIAFNAKPIARAAADASVSVPFLDSVLYLMGITREEVELADARDGIPPRPEL